MTFYNEHDPGAAAWLQELVEQGQIAEGTVDDRDVQEIRATDLRPYRRCHFFAGIGGWDLALQLAGWPDDFPVWTASLPCQPFSQAGLQRGTEDERHLWPVFRDLVEQCRSPIIFGEQVASKAGRAWLAAVQADLEALGYAFGAADLCAAGVGAPHIRQRLFWTAVRCEGQPDRMDRALRAEDRELANAKTARYGSAAESASCDASGLAHAEHPIRRPLREHRENGCNGQNCGRSQAYCESGARGEVCGLGHDERQGLQGHCDTESQSTERKYPRRAGDDGGLGHAQQLNARRHAGTGVEAKRETPVRAVGDASRASGADNPWSRVEYIHCLDNKLRPIPEAQPELFPLADGFPERVGLLRGYGNAIVPQVAATFIESVMEILEDAL